MKRVALFIAAILAAPCAQAATFNLTGDTVTVNRFLQLNGSILNDVSTDVVVGATVELDCNVTPARCGFRIPFLLSIDLSATSIVFNFNSDPDGSISFFSGSGPDSFNGFRFTGLNLGMPIGGADFSLSGASGSPALEFSASSVFVDLTGVKINGGGKVTVNLEPESAVIPLPASLPLLATAAFGLFGLRRRRNRS